MFLQSLTQMYALELANDMFHLRSVAIVKILSKFLELFIHACVSFLVFCHNMCFMIYIFYHVASKKYFVDE